MSGLGPGHGLMVPVRPPEGTAPGRAGSVRDAAEHAPDVAEVLSFTRRAFPTINH